MMEIKKLDYMVLWMLVAITQMRQDGGFPLLAQGQGKSEFF